MRVFGIRNSALSARAVALPSTIMAVVMLSAGTRARASLIIEPTYDPSLTVADDSAISAAIAGVEADITSPKNLTVDIYFTSMSSGLGESDTTFSNVSYFQYYTALAAVATSAAQMTALDSLGAAPNPGPMMVPAGKLESVLGVTKVKVLRGHNHLAVVDSTLAEPA